MATKSLAAPNLHRSEFDDAYYLPRCKDGQVKRRTSQAEKLRLLIPGAPLKKIEAYLDAFADLFAFRRLNASITRKSCNPRDWTAIDGPLTQDHILRHLLANRMPHLPAKWIAVRSLATSMYFVLDIDPDRVQPQNPTRSNRHPKLDTPTAADPKRCPSKLSFADRCRWAESCLARLGIDAHNRRHVLIQPSPSGGCHYYVFLDRPYFLYQAKLLLEAAGLCFTKGQVEFYPSESTPIRLPFGYMPLREGPHPWRDWFDFTDDYRYGRIKRHSLQKIYEQLEHLQLQEQLRPTHTTPRTRPESTNDPPAASRPVQHGIPRRFLPTPAPNPDTDADQRYWQLLHDGPKSPADAKELMDLGIRQEGTRNQALMHLAAHLIFIRGYSAEQATAELTTWAMNPRHQSKDIQSDLAKGTHVVEKEIIRMGQWHERHRDPSRKSASNHHRVGFAPTEISHLWKRLNHLPEADRKLLAEFLLHFLNFAKQHGWTSKDNSGWEATPAVNAVIRKWPGCHHLNYKSRISNAMALGLLSITKGAWHNPKGKGRARTYHLAIPVTNKNEWTLSYDDALNQLTHGPVVAPGVETAQALVTSLNTSADQHSSQKEHDHVHRHRDRRADRDCTRGRSHHNKRVHAAVVRPKGSRTNLAPRSRQRPPQPDANSRIRRPAPGELPTSPALAQPNQQPSLSGLPP